MPRIVINPNLAQCPDYSLDIYTASRLRFVNDDRTHEEAAQLLRDLWATINDAEKTLWQDQVQADVGAAAQRRFLENEEKEEAALEKCREEEELEKEERKKNRAKFAPIPDRGVPNQPPIIPVQSAVRRMKKGEYVQLWYYTNQGLDTALRSFANANDDAMTMIKGPDGSTTWAPASANDSKGMVEDKDLDWEDFAIAAARMVIAMQEAGWGADRIGMMVDFWSNIQRHPFRASAHPLDKRALLLYQGEQRRTWHFANEGSGHGYNLSEINEGLLRETKDKLYWATRHQKDEEQDNHVRTSPFSFDEPTTNYSPSFSPITTLLDLLRLSHTPRYLTLLYACHSRTPPLCPRACHYCSPHATFA